MSKSTYTTEELQTFGKTVLQQMGGRVQSMIGVKQLSVCEDSKNNMQLIIKFKAKAANKANCVKITIESNDLYTMEFLSIRGVKITSKGIESDLYCDMLINTFEQSTGLYLTM